MNNEIKKKTSSDDRQGLIDIIKTIHQDLQFMKYWRCSLTFQGMYSIQSAIKDINLDQKGDTFDLLIDQGLSVVILHDCKQIEQKDERTWIIHLEDGKRSLMIIDRIPKEDLKALFGDGVEILNKLEALDEKVQEVQSVAKETMWKVLSQAADVGSEIVESEKDNQKH